MKDSKTKKVIGIIIVLGILFAFGVAPIIEITIKDKNNNILMHSVYRQLIPSSQSLMPLIPKDAAKAEVKIIQKGVKYYYLCEDFVPTSLEEVKKNCLFSGSTEIINWRGWGISEGRT